MVNSTAGEEDEVVRVTYAQVTYDIISCCKLRIDFAVTETPL